MSQTTSNFVPANNGSEIGRLKFIIAAALSGVRTAIPVQVISVTNSGGASAIGTVSVKVLVKAVDGNGNAIKHGTIFNAPYLRIQGGTNAIIIDPQVGDIGLGVICDRDISAVQNKRGEAPPGSSRQNDLSDIIYLSTIISATPPTQYVQFNASGITITSPTQVTINAPTITLNGNVVSTGTVTNNGKNIGSTHIHAVTGISTGGSTVNSNSPT